MRSGTAYYCTITGNSSTNCGGGIASCTAYNCTISNNDAGGHGDDELAGGGGAIGSTLYDCLIVNNSAVGLGGGVHCPGQKVVNCTIAANTATGEGNGVSLAHVLNSIIWGNNGDDTWAGGYINTCAGDFPAHALPGPHNGNIASDPQFVGGGDYHLRWNSPCIDAGDNSFVNTMVDMDGDPRIYNGDIDTNAVVDMGADEFGLGDLDGDGYLDMYERKHGSSHTDRYDTPSATIYVDCAATNEGDGSAESPYKTIQKGLDAAVNDFDIVEVANGIYTNAGNTNLRFKHTKAMIVSANGPRGCLIDGGGTARGFVVDSDETLANVIAGLTITNCYVEGGHGGGILCERAVTIIGCRISGCAAIRDSWEYTQGGGLAVQGRSYAVVRDCVIQGNRASDYGGGIGIDGGGTQDASATLVNCVIVENEALQQSDECGTGVDVCCGSAVLKNCTLCGNNGVSENGAGLVSSYQGDVIVENSIVFGNEPSQFLCHLGGSLTVTHCVVQGGWDEGTSIIDENPGFYLDKYMLFDGSPCIDAGTSNVICSDFHGDARYDDPATSNSYSIWDIGADEFVGWVSDTDGDGLSCWTERMVLGLDPGTADTDGDGLNDGWEVRYGLDPLDGSTSATADPDNDGLTNAQEAALGTNPHDTDTDGDGMTDNQEVDEESDPLVADQGSDAGGPLLTVEQPVQGMMVLR